MRLPSNGMAGGVEDFITPTRILIHCSIFVYIMMYHEMSLYIMMQHHRECTQGMQANMVACTQVPRIAILHPTQLENESICAEMRILLNGAHA